MQSIPGDAFMLQCCVRNMCAVRHAWFWFWWFLGKYLWSNWTRKTKWAAYLMSQLCDQNLVLIGPRLTGEVRLGYWAGGSLGEPADGSVLGC